MTNVVYQPHGASKPWPEGSPYRKAGRIRPALHTVGAGRPYPLSAGLWLALPSNITGEAMGKIIVVEGN